LREIYALLNGAFPGQERWRTAVAKFYKLIVPTNADGDYFNVYSQDNSHLELLTPAINDAVDAVQAATWYRRNAPFLIWDEEYNACLMLPELMRHK
jgi:hypothetical protein